MRLGMPRRGVIGYVFNNFVCLAILRKGDCTVNYVARCTTLSHGFPCRARLWTAQTNHVSCFYFFESSDSRLCSHEAALAGCSRYTTATGIRAIQGLRIPFLHSILYKTIAVNALLR